jgi:hypothetical protein
MSEFLFHYRPVHPTTWAYLSSLLMIGLFFKFGRFWSIRNLDLALLISLAPGLLFVHFGDEQRNEQQRELAVVSQRLADQAAAADAFDPAIVPSDSAATQLDQPERPTGPELVPADPNDGDGPVLNGGASLIPASEGSVGVDSAEEDPAVESPGDPASDDPASRALVENASVVSDGQPTVGEEANAEMATVTPFMLGRKLRAFGFIWLLVASGLLLLRLLVDPAMVRRPLLEPNLSTGGLTFIGCSLFVFLMANVVGSPVTEKDLQGPRDAHHLLAGLAEPQDSADHEFHGPGNAVLYLLPSLVTMPQNWGDTVEKSEVGYLRMAKTMAILSHLAVVVGLVAIGYGHFGNIQTGIGAATLYLMLPYMAHMTGRVDHVLPAALLLWGVLCYRRPLPAGMFIGLATGVAYYPLFLLPLWISFYWKRGLMRFLSGVISMLVVVAVSLIFVSSDLSSFLDNLRRMFGFWLPLTEGLGGIWGLGWQPTYRWPVVAGFVALSGALAIWPVQKNLGTLLSCSAAVMVATQFWHGDGGGLYMAWYVPLTLLTIFRPNLEDRVALTVLGVGWFPRRRHSSVKGIAA